MLDQDLSGLPSLLAFRGKWLSCSQSHSVMHDHFAGPVAEALWAVAFLGWPQLLDFELTDCTFKANMDVGDLQTTANSPLRWGIRTCKGCWYDAVVHVTRPDP